MSPEVSQKIIRMAMEGFGVRRIAKETMLRREDVALLISACPELRAQTQSNRVRIERKQVKAARVSRLNRQVDRAFKCSLSHHSDGSRIENNQAQHRDAAGCIDWYQVRHYLDNKEWAEQLLAGATG